MVKDEETPRTLHLGTDLHHDPSTEEGQGLRVEHKGVSVPQVPVGDDDGFSFTGFFVTGPRTTTVLGRR